MMAGPALLPGATIGILGGGQLGRMMSLAARRMGYRIVVLDPSARCPTAQVADGVVVGALDDVEAGLQLAHQVDVLTLDTEHVPADVLARLAAVRPLRPGAEVLRTVQDRLIQKRFLDGLGIAQAPWREVSSDDDLAAAVAALGSSTILKVRRAGYDGKGQVRIEAGDDLPAARHRVRGEPCVLEQRIPFAREISVILARGVVGDLAVYPVAENVHRHHVLHTTRAPAPMPEPQRARAVAIAVEIATRLDHVGVMAVELFELADQTLLVNEIAPRTHNSGHYTYGACITSQFEQHIRAVAGLPLGRPDATIGAVMLNLIGDLWQGGPPPWATVLAQPDARLHLYGKDLAAPGRKMGHVVLLSDDTDDALARADAIDRGLRTR